MSSSVLAPLLRRDRKPQNEEKPRGFHLTTKAPVTFDWSLILFLNRLGKSAKEDERVIKGRGRDMQAATLPRQSIKEKMRSRGLRPQDYG